MAPNVLIEDSYFINNYAKNYGAGIEIRATGCKIINDTITGNEAPRGAGINIIGDNTLVENCTIFNNTATGTGGAGIYIEKILLLLEIP